jgi:phosphoenolpyruvate carboxykinase (GTP)
MGSSTGSETTAAALGQAGMLRRDPFAMLPFAGYNMANYFGHWVSMAQKTDRSKLPKIFFVNWFRKSADGKWLWPGYGDNSRVFKWICERVEGGGKAVETPIGMLPASDAIDTTGLKIEQSDMQELLSVDAEGWLKEAASIAEYYAKFGSHLPPALQQELNNLTSRLAKK